VAPTPIRSPQAEQALIGQQINEATLQKAGDGAAADARPINDVRSTADYRRLVSGNLLRRFLTETQ